MINALNPHIATSARPFAPYSAYKDSGVEWLGKIPAHWEVKPLKHLTAFSTGWTPPTGREDFYSGDHLWANIGDLGPKILSTTEKTISDAAVREARLSIVTAGSLLFSFKLSVGAVSITGVDMFTNEAIAAFAPSQRIDTRYLYWSAPVLVPRNAQENIYGAPLLSRERIANAHLLSPPMPEQHGIAAFLDRETLKIEDLVAKEKRLIELLQEQRTVLITRAATNGLDSTVRMKDSGVEWLGKIPAHWEVRRLKFILGTPLKYGANEVAELDDPDLPRYVRITDIDESDGLRKDTFKSLPADVAEEYLLREGDLLFARSGATAGKTFLYRRSWGLCAYAGYLIRARLNTNRACPEFVRYFTASSSYWQWLSGAFIQSTIQNVSAQRYASLILPQPSYREQCEIAAFLDRETARIDALIAKVRDAIERLEELRTALISAAVTGKIDVMNEAA